MPLRDRAFFYVFLSPFKLKGHNCLEVARSCPNLERPKFGHFPLSPPATIPVLSRRPAAMSSPRLPCQRQGSMSAFPTAKVPPRILVSSSPLHLSLHKLAKGFRLEAGYLLPHYLRDGFRHKLGNILFQIADVALVDRFAGLRRLGECFGI